MANLQSVLGSWKFSVALACIFALLAVINGAEGRVFFAVFNGLMAIFWAASARAQRRRHRR